MRNSIIILLILFATPLAAQQAPTEESDSETGIEAEEVSYFESDAFGGNLIIHQAEEIETLVGIRLAILEKQKGFKGYRIRLFSQVGSGARKKANNFRVDFEEEFQDTEAYLVYNNPNWEVHVGNFRNRFEAKQNLIELKEEFPKAFITRSIIEFPELKTSSDAGTEN
ncbi:MAG: hypothetical protein ACQES0_04390 [Bacteroidota bacterium]